MTQATSRSEFEKDGSVARGRLVHTAEVLVRRGDDCRRRGGFSEFAPAEGHSSRHENRNARCRGGIRRHTKRRHVGEAATAEIAENENDKALSASSANSRGSALIVVKH